MSFVHLLERILKFFRCKGLEIFPEVFGSTIAVKLFHFSSYVNCSELKRK